MKNCSSTVTSMILQWTIIVVLKMLFTAWSNYILVNRMMSRIFISIYTLVKVHYISTCTILIPFQQTLKSPLAQIKVLHHQYKMKSISGRVDKKLLLYVFWPNKRASLGQLFIFEKHSNGRFFFKHMYFIQLGPQLL